MSGSDTETARTVSGAMLPSKLADHPGRIRLEPVAGEVTVTMGGVGIARTTHAIRLHEGEYPPVL